MTGPLPAYSGATSCPKCTCEFIDSTYYASQPRLAWTLDELALITNTAGGGPESMLRRCHDCGWAWLEHCADAATATVNETTRLARLGAFGKG